MKRVVLTLAVTLLATGAYAHGWNNIDGDDCSSNGFRIDGRRAHVAEESFDAPGLRTVNVSNAPVSIKGGSGRGYTITVCKAAADASDLARIHVSVENGNLVSRGPDHDDWMVSYRIEAPNGAQLDIESRNGPLSIRDLDGTLNVRSKNGPVSLHNVGGTVDAVTTNGPVSVHGGSGSMKVKASNGPISVTLDGSSWVGSGLDASTSNGPLSVKVARDYNSGVLVESNGRGPISCRAEACEGQYRARSNRRSDWDHDDEPRRFEFGRGPQVVRISTVNGPLTIRDAD
jgi:hypothetical protein